MRSKYLVIAVGVVALQIVGLAGRASAAPFAPMVSVKEITSRSDIIQVRSTKRETERREHAAPGDEFIGYVNENGDELIGPVGGGELLGRVERQRDVGPSLGEQFLQGLASKVLGAGNQDYYPPQPQSYEQQLYSRCPVDYYGRPDRQCVAYIQQRLAANSTRSYGQAYQCPTASGIAVITRSYSRGCIPVDNNGLYHGNGEW